MTGSIGVLMEERKLGAVARVTVQNSAKLNTLNSHLMLAFVTELEALAKRDHLRAVILTVPSPKALAQPRTTTLPQIPLSDIAR